MKPLAFCVLLALAVAGCGSRVVIVPGDAPVQLAEPVEAYVYVTDPATGAKIKSNARVGIPEGYACFPPALLRPATKPTTKP